MSWILPAALLMPLLAVGCGSDTDDPNGTAPSPAPPPPPPALPAPGGTAPRVVYDNDGVLDVYTDEYLAALASAGEISLRGMITASEIAPLNRHVTHQEFELFLEQRRQLVTLARQSGFGNLPEPVEGVRGGLRRPASDAIEDTPAIGSVGSRLIVDEARLASPEDPLVVVAGGSLSTVADAFLLDPSIADRVVVAWLGGDLESMADYNGWLDPWAAYIVLERLPLIQFPAKALGKDAAPLVPKTRLLELPPTPLRQWLIVKDHPGNALPAGRDADAPPAIALREPAYMLETKRVSFGGWQERWDREIPVFREDPAGPALVVTAGDLDLATAEWWRALENPAAWGPPVE